MTIQVATYNIELTKNPDRLIENIIELSKTTGIFCLQEVLAVPGQQFVLTRLHAALGSNWRTEYFLGKADVEPGTLSHGVAVLWNTALYQLQSTKRINLPKMPSLSLFERLVEQVFGFTGTAVQRRAISVEYRTPAGKTLRVTSVHLDSMGGAANRRKQIKFLMSELTTHVPMDGEIICGDFNTNSLINKTDEINQLHKIFSGDGFDDATNDVAWSADLFNTDFGGQRKLLKYLVSIFDLQLRKKLDYIWSRGFRIIESTRIDVPGSDHCPVVATLKDYQE